MKVTKSYHRPVKETVEIPDKVGRELFKLMKARSAYIDLLEKVAEEYGVSQEELEDAVRKLG